MRRVAQLGLMHDVGQAGGNGPLDSVTIPDLWSTPIGCNPCLAAATNCIINVFPAAAPCLLMSFARASHKVTHHTSP